jgi:hypothetical protein
MTTVGRWSPNKVRARVLDGTWVAATPEEDGDATDAALMMVPTSIAYTGTSATVGANGSVEFTACSSLSLNGVFTGDYDNYMISMRLNSSAGTNLAGRLRNGSTDASTGYIYQTLSAASSSVAGARYSSTSWEVADIYATQRAGSTIHLYGPYLSQPTAYRNTGANDFSSAAILDHAGTHTASSLYDGFTFFTVSATTITGLVSVYGIRGA